MLPPFRIFRVPNVLNDRVHGEEAREVVAKARRMPDEHKPPDTFVGRKTREPFPPPEEDEFYGRLADLRGLSNFVSTDRSGRERV